MQPDQPDDHDRTSSHPRRPRPLARPTSKSYKDARQLVLGIILITTFDAFYVSQILTGSFYHPAWLTFAIPIAGTILWLLAAIPVVRQLRRDPHAWRAMRTWRTRRRATTAMSASFPTQPPQPEQRPPQPPAPPAPPTTPR